MGEIPVAVDYGDSFMFNELLEIFHYDYPKAKLTPSYQCEVNILRQLEMDSFRFVVINRKLTKEEIANLEKKDIKIRSAMVAKAAVALVVSEDFGLSRITQDDLRKLLSGETSSLKINGQTQQVDLVFDQGCGSNYQYFQQLWFKDVKMSNKLKAKKTPAEVLDFVSKNKGTIGFVHSNWISDRMDSSALKMAKKIKVLEVEANGRKGYHLPFQSQITSGIYPFIQEIYMYDLQGYSGLAQGFIAFTASQPGQLIIKKSGLVPAKDMGRSIELVEE